MFRTLIAALLGSPPPQVTAQAAHTATNYGSALLLDVRDYREWSAGHPAPAEHLPLVELDQRLAELPNDRRIITVSRSGRRSVLAARRLADRGYDAASLTGGMKAWSAAHLPTATAGLTLDT